MSDKLEVLDYEKPTVRDYGDLTELTAVVIGPDGEELSVKSGNKGLV